MMVYSREIAIEFARCHPAAIVRFSRLTQKAQRMVENYSICALVHPFAGQMVGRDQGLTAVRVTDHA